MENFHRAVLIDIAIDRLRISILEDDIILPSNSKAGLPNAASGTFIYVKKFMWESCINSFYETFCDTLIQNVSIKDVFPINFFSIFKLWTLFSAIFIYASIWTVILLVSETISAEYVCKMTLFVRSTKIRQSIKSGLVFSHDRINLELSSNRFH